MHDLLRMTVALVVWGLIPASVQVLLDLMVSRSIDKQQRIIDQRERQRLREWRTHIAYVTPHWPRRAHMDSVCYEHRVLWHISTAHEDALAHQALMIAHQADHDMRRSLHIHN